MGDDAEDTREAMRLQDVQKLERLHLETETSVHEKKHQVGNLSQVDHSRNIVGTLDKRQTTILAAHNGNRTAHIR